MFRGFKKPRILLTLMISLLIPIASGYLLYCDLADNDLFSPDAEYEHADIDDFFLVSNFQNQLKLFGSIGSNTLSPVFLQETYTIEQVSPFCFLSSYIEQNPLVLRCQKTSVGIFHTSSVNSSKDTNLSSEDQIFEMQTNIRQKWDETVAGSFFLMGGPAILWVGVFLMLAFHP